MPIAFCPLVESRHSSTTQRDNKLSKFHALCPQSHDPFYWVLAVSRYQRITAYIAILAAHEPDSSGEILGFGRHDLSPFLVARGKWGVSKPIAVIRRLAPLVCLRINGYLPIPGEKLSYRASWGTRYERIDVNWTELSSF